MYQITKKVESAINDGVWQCEFVCDDEADVANLPTSIKAGKGGKDIYDNIVCEAGSSAYIVDDNASSKLYILNNQDEWVPQEIGGGSVGSSSGDGSHEPCSWNDLLDKPFYEETTYNDTLVFPTSTEGLEYIFALDQHQNKVYLYLISEAVPTLDDCVNGVTWIDSGTGMINTRTYDEIRETYEARGVITPTYHTYVIPYAGYSGLTDNVDATFTFPKAGIWGYETSITDRYSVVELTFPGSDVFSSTTIKTIDPKFLPDLPNNALETLKKMTFDFEFEYSSSNYHAFSNFDQLQTAYDNNLIFNVIYKRSGDAYPNISRLAVPLKDCLTLSYGSGGTMNGVLTDGKIELGVSFNADLKVIGAYIRTDTAYETDGYSMSMVKCYASLF